MSGGGYYGGSTVFGPGSPLMPFPKKKKKKVRKKVSLALAKTTKQATPQSFPALDPLVKNIICSVVVAQIRKSNLPSLPKKMRPRFDADVKKAGGIARWAESFPQYQLLFDRQLRKFQRKIDLPSQQEEQLRNSGDPSFHLRDQLQKYTIALESVQKIARECEEKIKLITEDLQRLGMKS